MHPAEVRVSVAPFRWNSSAQALTGIIFEVSLGSTTLSVIGTSAGAMTLVGISLIENARTAEIAALKCASPACEAVTVQLPGAAKYNVEPTIAHEPTA